jgi:hypothetical protein
MNARSLLALLALSLCIGCATLKPYERGELMTSVMMETPDSLEVSFEVHVHRTREAMAGAELGEGAACGCN